MGDYYQDDIIIFRDRIVKACYALAFLALFGILLKTTKFIISGENFSIYSEYADYIFTGALAILLLIAIRNFSITSNLIYFFAFVLPAVYSIYTAGLSIYTIINTTFGVSISIFLLYNQIKLRKALKLIGSKIGGNLALRIIGIIAGLLLIYAAISTIAIKYFDIAYYVYTADELSADDMAWIQDNNILNDGEEIIYFYDEVPFSNRSEGSILTTQYVGVWYHVDGKLETGWLAHGEVCSLERVGDRSFATDANYMIGGPGDDNWIRVSLSTVHDRDLEFIAELERRAPNLANPGSVPECDADAALDGKA